MLFLPEKNKTPLLLALVTLLLIALALAAASWQALRQQRRYVDSHLLMTARSVHAAIIGSVRRRALDGGPRLAPGTLFLINELQHENGVHFLGVFSATGERLFTPRFDEEARRFQLPQGALDGLRQEGEWRGIVASGESELFIYGRAMPRSRAQSRLRPQDQGRPSHADAQVSAPSGPPDAAPDTGPDVSPEASPSPPALPPAPVPPPGDAPAAQDVEERFLVVGLNMAPHLAAYRSFARTVLLQTGLVFLAAAGVWWLGVIVLNRRELARKAVTMERLQSRLLDALPDGLVHLDANGEVLAANPAAHRLLNVEGGALVGQHPLALGPQAAALLAEESGQTPPGSTGQWRQQQHGDRSMEVLSLPMDSPATTSANKKPRKSRQAGEREKSQGGRLVLLRDRTELKRLEQTLNDAKRMATVGVLAAGVAHEIRNPLSALRGFAQFFAKKLAGKQPEEQYATTMVAEADRLNRVVGDLLNLARPRSLLLGPVNLPALAEELEQLVHTELEKTGTQLSTAFQTAVCHADADAIKQCLLNLILNSLQAMAESGAPGPFRIVMGASPVPGGVAVIIQDNGPGMDAEQREHAFDPFYTSKPRGAGLGLAIVEKTMREHGGTATIEAPSGHGVTVRLVFPDPNASSTYSQTAGDSEATGLSPAHAAPISSAPASAEDGSPGAGRKDLTQ